MTTNIDTETTTITKPRIKINRCVNVIKEIPEILDYYNSRVIKVEKDDPNAFKYLPTLNFPKGYEELKEYPCYGWKGFKTKSGYAGLGGYYTQYNAHRLSWIIHNNSGNMIPKHVAIAHLCGNRLCTNPKHLIAVTGRENATHRIVHGTQNVRTSINKLTDEQVVQIRIDYATGNYTHKELSEIYHISRRGVSKITAGDYYKHLDGPITKNYSRKSNSKVYSSSKITTKQIKELRELYKRGSSLTELSQKYNMSRTNISKIVNKIYFETID